MAHGQCLKISYHCRCSPRSLSTEEKALVSRTDSSRNPERCFDVVVGSCQERGCGVQER